MVSNGSVEYRDRTPHPTTHRALNSNFPADGEVNPNAHAMLLQGGVAATGTAIQMPTARLWIWSQQIQQRILLSIFGHNFYAEILVGQATNTTKYAADHTLCLRPPLLLFTFGRATDTKT